MDKHSYNSGVEKSVLRMTRNLQDLITFNDKNLWQKQPAAAAAKSLQSCPTLCDPRDGSPPGSAVSGILQARTLKWVAISYSSAWK